MKKTTAAGVVFLAKDTGRCMLQLREGNKRFNHTWGFWGGMMEKGETPYQCIQRELDEEIGFIPELQKLNPIDVYQSKNKHFMYIKGRNSKRAKSSNEKILRLRNYFHTRRPAPSVKMFLQFFLEHKKVFLLFFSPKY